MHYSRMTAREMIVKKSHNLLIRDIKENLIDEEQKEIKTLVEFEKIKDYYHVSYCRYKNLNGA